MPAKSAPRRTLVSLADAADRLGCSPRTIRRWIAEGRLTAYRLGSRAIRIDLEQIDALLTPIPTAGDRKPAA